MKRWLLLALVLGMLFVSVAAGPGPRGNFALAGKINAIKDGTVTVQVLTGNMLVKPYLNKDLTVSMTSSTRYLLKDGTVIAFTDLKVGDAVSVNGTVVNQVWTASRITVGAQLIHFQ
jgi:hypothetical protein